ncbi:MAG: DNA recombination protein RmuC [Gemmatimonadaceae bacterium]
MNPLLLFIAGIVVGAVFCWLVLRERNRARVAALEAVLESERRYAGERRNQLERSDALVAQLASLTETHRDLSAQTQHLVDTLRSPVVRGQWGEMQLRRVCELAQMLEHVDFVLQETGAAGESRLRPDLTVLLPGGRTIVVDAKAPLHAYLDSMDAADERRKTDLLRAHARQVREHITRLGAKGYWEQFPASPDFVVLFLPGEALFSTALQYDATLVEYGVERNVILASPTTLIALLRAIGHGWERQRVSQNAEEIRVLGTELHDRFQSFTGHLGEVRRGLERAVDAFNRSVGVLELRVIPQARRFGSLTGASRADEAEVRPVDEPLRSVSSEPPRQAALD